MIAPLTMLLLAWPLAAERPALLSMGGAILGFAGVVLLVTGAAGPINPWGVVVSLSAMVMSSVGFVLARRWRDDTPVLAVTAWQLTAGGAALVVVAGLVEGPPPSLDAGGIAGAAYVSLVATALAFVTWFAALKHLPAGAVGLVGLLNPVAGALLGALVVGETVSPVQAIGMAVILAGVSLGLAPGVDPGTGRPRRP